MRCSLERSPAGVRVVLEQGHARYSLAASRFVLEGITVNLRGITRAELEAGRATIGRLGYLALARLSRAPRLAA